MHVVADTTALVADGIISDEQATELETRSRQAMMALAINAVLFLGIISVTGGLIVWLQNAVAVALCGTVAAALGVAILVAGSETIRIFGSAATLIGAGMLAGGGTVELFDRNEAITGPVLVVAGGILLLLCGWLFARGARNVAFVLGALTVLGMGLHLSGLVLLLERAEAGGMAVTLANLYAALLLVVVGWFLDVRLITALAIVPFAQVLDAGTAYYHAVYAFYSPEPTLTILQMSGLMGICIWIAATRTERSARHARSLAVLAFVVANICALVGSLWGDVVGENIWGPVRSAFPEDGWQEWSDARDAFRASALVIPPWAYAILWAVALVAITILAARRGNRGLFNTAVVFGVIHAYTQLFESFADEPLAYVLGGLVLIPLAWAMWQMDQKLRQKSVPG